MFLVRASIYVKRHHDKGNCNQGKHLIGTCLQFQRFHFPSCGKHGGKHCGIQADMLEKKLGVLQLDPQTAEGDCVPQWV